MDLHLKDKVVFVTGSTGGVGFEISKAFLEEGALLAACYRGSLEKLDPLRTWMDENSVHRDRMIPVEVDLVDREQIARSVKYVIEAQGRIDVLVNNAGHTVELPFIGLDADTHLEIMDVNFQAPALLMKHTLKHMMKRKSGSIVNVSSVVGERLGRGVSVYAAAKSALNRLTQVVALEMGGKGIRINSVAPGLIETSMSRPVFNRLSRTNPQPIALKRYGRPDEVAKAVLFLASDVSSYVSGHVLTVDGGISL